MPASPRPLNEAGIDLVFAAGPRMAALMEALPPARRGGYAETADALIPIIAGALRAGDIVLVKGSNGSRMSRVVAALHARSRGRCECLSSWASSKSARNSSISSTTSRSAPAARCSPR